MIRFTKIAPFVLAGVMLAGCTSTEPQTPPASITASAEAPVNKDGESPAESQQDVVTTSIEWEDAKFPAQGAYTVEQVSLAAETLTSYVNSGFANPDFLTGAWASDPTGTRIAEELQAEFTVARLDYIRTLDPKSPDPNVLNDVNSVAYILYPEGVTSGWKQPEEKATVRASDLTFTEEVSTGTLKATFTVEIAVPVATETGQGESTTTYTLNTWLLDDAGSMKIDGYANSWKTTPHNAS